jgi:heme-degrading monooxygenase HmoA
VAGRGRRAGWIVHLILWTFRPRAGREAEFERVYGPDGDWARFFRGAPGYLGTDLLRATGGEPRYVTIDRWSTRAAYEAFRAGNLSEYESIDRRCESLTDEETSLGSFTTVDRAAPGGDPE